MNAIVSAVHAGGVVSYPRSLITTRLGINRVHTGWEFLRLKHAKHFGFGIEVRGALPDFKGREELRRRAVEGVTLAMERYGDMLIDADVQVKEGSLGEANDILQGYLIDFELARDWSKPVLIEITWDRRDRSYRIMGVVYNHLIDGVPLALYMQLLHNHLVLGGESLLSRSTRKFDHSYRFHIDAAPVFLDKTKWLELVQNDDSTLIPVGSQVDVSKSAIPELRKKVSRETGRDISTSSLEIALIALEMKMTWVTDYIAQGSLNDMRRLDVQKGYNGLGISRMKVPEGLSEAAPRHQYQWICNTLGKASLEMERERRAHGRASLFYDRYRRIAPFFLDLFDWRISYDSVMAVAGTQLIGSNLNGVDYGVPLYVGGITPGDLRLVFIPSHGEHNERTRVERARRSLATHVTEISFSCGPRIIESPGRSVLYKSLKISPSRAREILRGWGYHSRTIDALSPSELVREVFLDAYNPASPGEGRIELRASEYLHM